MHSTIHQPKHSIMLGIMHLVAFIVYMLYNISTQMHQSMAEETWLKLLKMVYQEDNYQ